MGCLTGLAFGIKQLLTTSQLFYNLENILKISLPGIFFALSIVITTLGLLLFLFRLFQLIAQTSLRLDRRILLMVAAIFIFLPVIRYLDLGFPFWTWSLMAFILLVLLDLFVDGHEFNLTWLMVWSILFSTFFSSLQYKYVLDKDAMLMKQYAKQLLDTDPVLNEKLAQLKEKFKYSDDSTQWLASLHSDPYVMQFYKIDAQKEDFPFQKLSNETRLQLQQYLPLPKLAYRDLKYLDRYEFLYNKKGRTIESRGQILGLEGSLQVGMSLQEEKLYFKNNRLNYEWRPQETSHIIFQRALGSYFRPLSLFAVFFLLFILVILLLFGIHRYFPIIPSFFAGIFQLKKSFSIRIQLWVLGIILGSSILIGLITILYFKTVSNERTEQQVFQHAHLAKEQLEKRLPLLSRSDTSLSTLSFPCQIYGSTGNLISSNQNDLLHHENMHPFALEWLRLGSVPFTIRTGEKAGSAYFYNSLNNEDGSIAGFIRLPYSYNNPKSQQELSNFVGSIFSLYVFLMFIAGGLAIWVANSITDPISRIGESLSKLQLGRNTPLVWKNEDEIGLLIKEYNQALAKLEESTKQLKQSEREGAWREMAKQVAHEIKNPLTPMKLSVQYLMRAYQANPDNIGPLLKRMSNTLIEQIEGLTNIANEFSHFAKMPSAQLEKMDLIPIVTSVSELFANQNANCNIQFHSQLASFSAKIDKDQMLRVLNNLITNAIQAIPNGRQGQITIRVETFGKGVRIEIQDNGSGIPIELQEKVFYPMSPHGL